MDNNTPLIKQNILPKKANIVIDAFSKALLEKDYQQSLWKNHGSFAHMVTLMKATESLSKRNSV